MNFNASPRLLSVCLLASLSFFAHGQTVPAAELTIMGVVLGGKLGKLPKCNVPFEIETQKTCWVGKPFLATTGKQLGSIKLPNPGSRPRWASYAMFEVLLSREGVLEELTVKNPGFSFRDETIASIKERFGPPQQIVGDVSDASKAIWPRKDVRIEVLCAPKLGCDTSFMTPAYASEREAELKSREAWKTKPI